MQVKRSSIQLIAILAIFAIPCFVTVQASAADNVLYSFKSDGADGNNPYSALIFDSAGNLYGTTFRGGAHAVGTVFELSPVGDGTWTEKVLHTFIQDGTDGAGPSGGLIFDHAGNLYGTTTGGGLFGAGTAFELSPAGGGSWTENILHSFGSDPDGANLTSSLIFDAAGNLYGTAATGGAGGAGAVFELSPAGGGTWTETVLYSFTGMDAIQPNSALIFDAAGNLYGTTYTGARSSQHGTVYELMPAGGGTWTERVLYSFSGTDGDTPQAELIFDTAGNLYSTTAAGGSFNQGTLFKLTPAGGGTWTETVLHSFGNGTDGARPQGGLIFDAAGNLYSTTKNGGSFGGGTVFRYNAQGLVLLQNFSGADGANPLGSLILDAGGNLYGTTSNGGTASQGTVFEITNTPPVPYQFVTIPPCRLIDTRQTGGPIPGGTFRTFPVPQEGGCNVPATATAYSLNVTVVPTVRLGYLTIWPAGIDLRPVVSTLNSLDGRVKADAAIVPAGTNGAVNIYATDTTNVILDINGYFAPVTPSTLAFYPLPPCRVADTRNSNFPQGLGPPFLAGGHERAFPILNAASCNIPSSAAAYSLNFTVVPHGGLSFLTVWPTGQTRPTVSTLNDALGRVIANAGIVVAGAGNEVSAYATNDTDLIIDINGYFAPPGTGGLSLYAVSPCRVIDTRHIGNGQPFTGMLNPPVDVEGSVCGPPASARAYAFNATVVPSGSLGYLTLWPDGSTRPAVSTLNALDGSISSNMALVPAGTQGKVDAYASGITQLVLDISAYFAP